MTPAPAIFRSPVGTLVADTCEPLRDAAAAGDVRLDAWVHGSYPGTEIPAGSLAEISTVGAWNSDREQTWGLDWHHNEGIEFTYVESGRLQFGCEGNEYQLSGGSFTITRPWQRHRVGDPYVGASRLGWVILDVGVRYPNQNWRWPDWLVCSPNDTRQLERMLRQNDQPVWRAHDDVRTAFARMTEIARQPFSPGLELRMKLHLNALIVAVLEMLEREQPTLEAHLSSAERTVELFLAQLPERLGEDWSVDRMAAECGLHRSRFTHYCQLATNTSPKQYLLQHRLTEAKRLLLDHPDRSVTEIAYEVGFSSSQHFATAFRARFGRSPRRFRMR